MYSSRTKNSYLYNKRQKAICQLKSWLSNQNINSSYIENGDCDLEIKNQDKTLKIIFSNRDMIKEDFIKISLNLFLDRNQDNAIKMFHTITKTLGIGTPDPVNRGNAPERVNYQNDFDLVVFRHRDLRKSPNPTNEQFEKYKNCIHGTSLKFLISNKALCIRNGLELDDLKQMASIWVINYCGRFEILNPKENENEKKCWSYLKQRFSEYRSILQKKEKSMLPDKATLMNYLYSGYDEINELILYGEFDNPINQ